MSQTVLFVDDNPAVLEGLARALRKEPYEIVTATTTREAEAILAGRPVSVIVSDEEMPGTRGTDFLSRVAKQYPHVVRIVLTGNVTPSVWTRAINSAGVYRFLGKPCNEVELSLTIRQAIKQAGPAHETHAPQGVCP